MLEILHYFRLEIDIFCLDVKVMESKVGEMINVLLCLDIKENIAFTVTVAHHDMVRVGEW